MAEPDTAKVENPLDDIMSAVTGAGVPADDLQDARYMLALLQPQGRLTDGEFRTSAQELFQEWFDEAKAKLSFADLSSEDLAFAVRSQMVDDMIKEMTLINGGKELSETTQQHIRNLLQDKDPESFADAMMVNRATVLAHLKQQKEALAQDPDKRPAPFAGIMAMLAAGDSALGGVSVYNVDLSPVELAKGNEYSVLKNVFHLNGLGNGAESTLAMIQGIPRENWGEYNDKTGGYANLPPYATPAAPEQQKEFWNGPEGVRIAEMLEARGVVEFANDDAKNAWVKEMADAMTGDDRVKNAHELTERMREFAGKNVSITMESEIVAGQDKLSAAAVSYTKVLENSDFISFADKDAREAWHVELERIDNEHGAVPVDQLMEHAKDFIDSYNQEHPQGIVVQHDNIAASMAEYKAIVEQRAAEAVVADPVCAAGAGAFLPGESGVACIANADPGATAPIPAVAEVRNEMRAVPNVDPAVVAPEVESTPMVGPR